MRSRGREDQKASRRRQASRRHREMLIRKASRRRREMLEIGPDYYSAVREPSPYDSIIVNDDAEDRPSVGLSVVAFVICSISGAIVGTSITWAAFRLFLPACH
jgi:hypothetical protein